MSKIVLIDDEVGIRHLCYEVLTQAGHTVMTLPSGGQLLEVVKNEKPDLIILDINIPGDDGLELLKRLPRESGKRVAVVIFSGRITPEIEKAAMEAGALDVIQKGIDIKEFRSRIGKILESKDRFLKETPKTSALLEKILIVDDEEGIRKLLAIFFGRKGYQVLTAQNGEEALALVASEKPAMIFLDVTMPGMDGLLTLKKIREIDSKVGVVMATGLHDSEIAREAVALGAYAYVTKPFDMKYLELVVLTRLLLSA